MNVWDRIQVADLMNSLANTEGASIKDFFVTVREIVRMMIPMSGVVHHRNPRNQQVRVVSMA